MKHYDEDYLLKGSLDLLDEAETREFEIHLERCDECRGELDRIRCDNKVIASVQPIFVKPEYVYPLAMKFSFKSLSKIAALLLMGFIVGYSSSILSRPCPVTVHPQQLITKPAHRYDLRLESCDSDALHYGDES